MPEDRIDAVAGCGLGAAEGLRAPVLAPGDVRPLPRRGPRLFALDLADEEGAADAVQAAVGDALADAGMYEPEKRTFWPHVTLARVRGGGRDARRHGSARVAPLALPPPPIARLACPVVALYRSHLSPQGARYEPLAWRELGGRR